MEKTVKQRLVEFILHKGLSQGKFERICEMSNGYVNNLKGTPGAKKLQSVLRAFPELNTDWLLYGRGEMLRSHAQVVQNNQYGDNAYVAGSNNSVQCSRCGEEVSILTPDEIQGAPIIPTALSRQPNIDILEVLSDPRANAERSTIKAQGIDIDVWHRVRDSSLMPSYQPGDMLGLWSYPQGEENPIPGNLYAVDTYSNGLIVRILFPDNDDYRAHAINTAEYPDFIVKRRDIIRIYRVMIRVSI